MDELPNWRGDFSIAVLVYQSISFSFDLSFSRKSTSQIPMRNPSGWEVEDRYQWHFTAGVFSNIEKPRQSMVVSLGNDLLNGGCSTVHWFPRGWFHMCYMVCIVHPSLGKWCTVTISWGTGGNNQLRVVHVSIFLCDVDGFFWSWLLLVYPTDSFGFGTLLKWKDDKSKLLLQWVEF